MNRFALLAALSVLLPSVCTGSPASAQSYPINRCASSSPTRQAPTWPVSLHLIDAFEKLGIAAEMKTKTVVFKQRNERFAPVARGEVEIGFNQISEILVVPGIELLGPLPAGIQNYTLFSAGIVANSKQVDAAKTFVRFIASPGSASSMRTKGFE